MTGILYKILNLRSEKTQMISGSAVFFQSLVSLSLYFFTFFVSAQEMVFSPVDVQHQLNEEKIRNIIELEDGRIGIFTEGMLNLYEGGGFKTIHIDDSNSTAISSYTGFHHSYIENNNLWFKCLGRLSLINISKEQSEKDPYQTLKKMGFNGTVTDLFVDTQKDVWVITSSGKLLYYDQVSKKVKLFLKQVAIKNSTGDPLYDIAYYNKRLYLFYRSGLIRCFDRSTAREIYSKAISGGISDDFNQWMHTAVVNKYIYIVRAGIRQGKLIRFDTETLEVKTLIKADNYWLNTFTANKKGDFVMSSSKGLWHFTSGSTTGVFHPKLKVLGRNDIATEVSTVFFDSREGFWAGTLNKGLYYYHHDRFRFPQYPKQYFQISEDNELQINCFEQVNDGKLLVGTSEGLFAMRFPIDSSVPPIVLLPKTYCNALLKDVSGNIWISTHSGLYVLEKSGILRLYSSVATNYVYQTKNETLYICTEKDGLLRWDKASKSFQCIYKGTILPNIVQLTSWNEFLIGFSSKGPFIMDPLTYKIIISSGKDDKRFPMFSEKNRKYTCIFKDSDEHLWVGTYDGLTVWDNKNRKLYRMDTETGLINNSIKAIIEDKDQSIWVTTSRGVSQIIKNCSNTGCTFSVINHYKHTGIIEHSFAGRAAFFSPKSGLFLGGIDGFNNIPHSSSIEKTNYLKPVFFNLKLFGKNILPGIEYNGNVVLKNAMAATDTLLLDYNQNFFSIGFSGLNYINPSQSHFRYKLEGIDEDWRFENPTSDYGEASYTGVAPGQYTFTLETSYDGIHWPDKPNTMVIVIKPPIWKTTEAKLIYFVLLCWIIWFSTKHIIKRNTLRREREHIEAVEKAKSDFITNMSHELRTPLTLIITPLRSLIHKVSDRTIKTELHRISNNANLLLDTVNQLLEFKKIDTWNEVLHLHFCDNLSFIEEICDAYTDMANEKGIVFTKEIFDGDLHIHVDKQKVKRIIVNLLSNAIKFTPKGGSVSLSATINETAEELCLVIKDTGIGIQSGELNRIFERFYQADNQQGNSAGSGIGLFMVKQYINLHGGSVAVESKPGNGTCFKITLSVKEENNDPLHETDPLQHKKTILVVEDHPGFRLYLSTELSHYYNVLTAENGKIGLEKTLEHLPDLVITDMMMPEIDGTVFCKTLRNTISISHTPIIMLTGKASDEAHFEGYEAGADAYLVKPFDIKFLLLRITKLLELSVSRQKIFAMEKEVKPELITTNPLDKEMLERALRYVDTNLSNPDYSVEKFSMDMGMDRTGLYRKLIALTGYSPINFIRTIRLKKAAELLSQNTMTIADVADEVGFNSMSYFSKCFHESFGKTPSQYREERISRN